MRDSGLCPLPTTGAGCTHRFISKHKTNMPQNNYQMWINLQRPLRSLFIFALLIDTLARFGLNRAYVSNMVKKDLHIFPADLPLNRQLAQKLIVDWGSGESLAFSDKTTKLSLLFSQNRIELPVRANMAPIVLTSAMRENAKAYQGTVYAYVSEVQASKWNARQNYPNFTAEYVQCGSVRKDLQRRTSCTRAVHIHVHTLTFAVRKHLIQKHCVQFEGDLITICMYMYMAVACNEQEPPQ